MTIRMHPRSLFFESDDIVTLFREWPVTEAFLY